MGKQSDRSLMLTGRAGSAAIDGEPKPEALSQVMLCINDLEEQLHQQHMSLADVVSVELLTTNFSAVRAHADALGRLLRDAGAKATIRTTEVDHLDGSSAAVEARAQAIGYWSQPDDAAPRRDRFGSVPEHLRAAVFSELEALRRGERPEQHAMVEAVYDGAVLIEQPDEIWHHPSSEAIPTNGGGWEVAVPLWTTTDSPGDLTAVVDINPLGEATLSEIIW